MKSWMLLPILGLACVAADADVYRWRDADGKIHYSDQPPAEVEKLLQQIQNLEVRAAALQEHRERTAEE